jgi:hypothetical protein
MKLKLSQNRGVTYVVDEEADFIVGRLRQRYELIYDNGDLVAMIDNAEEAIPLLEAHARANPPKWESSGSGYQKLTWFGSLLVEPASSGGWLVYRDLFPLLRDDGFAIFNFLSEAKAAADAHLYDGYPNAVAPSDKLLWSEISVRPLEVGVPNVIPAMIEITGTLDGELDPIAFPAWIPPAEQISICRLAQVAVLEKAVGMTVVSAFLALTQATNRTKADLQQAADAVAVEMPRLIKLFKRCRENGRRFEATAKAQGKIVLRGLPGCSEVADSVLDCALDLPLQLMARWISWDKTAKQRTAA